MPAHKGGGWGVHVSIIQSTINIKKQTKKNNGPFHPRICHQNSDRLAICNMTCWITQVSAMWTSQIGCVADVLIRLVDLTFTAVYLS